MTVPVASAEDGCEPLVVAYNSCGYRLFRGFSEQPGNIVLSPYSIGMAMAMALAGARGENAVEIAKVLDLKLPHEGIDAANAGLLASLSDLSSASLQLGLANALVLTEKDTAISKAYLAVVRQSYAAELLFSAALATVNGWVRQKTLGKIDSILDTLDPHTALVLINAIYLKAPWRTPFDPEATRNETFHLLPGAAEVPTMKVLGDFALAQLPGYRSVRLPYENRRLAMLILLPDHQLGDLVRRVDSEQMANLRAALRAPPRPVLVSLPRFHLTFRASLVKAFTKMGMRLAFDPDVANFSGMTGTSHAKLPLAIGQIIHNAVIDVTEEGTEAAAATVVGVRVGRMPSPSETFRVERPFLFAIVDDATDSVLFQGRVVDPR